MTNKQRYHLAYADILDARCAASIAKKIEQSEFEEDGGSDE